MDAAACGYSTIHADQWLVVLDKCSGLLSVPGIGPEKADCLVARACTRWPTARIVHRLDRDTSGVIVLALDAATHRNLSMQFERRAVSKRYEALVAGHPSADEGSVDLPIRKDLDNPPLQMVDAALGRPSQTSWRVMERLAAVPDPVRPSTGTDHVPCARLSLSPLTGRSHQLRLHMRAVGHTILGDDLYGTPGECAAATRLCLHATALSFTHPGTGERSAFGSPAPF
ncbi:MAG: RluA family pseudouridine synthase [Phycisphaerales bacterium]|nr:RluA family pseudouridine synthase [Phycisphaerales bacterium]